MPKLINNIEGEVGTENIDSIQYFQLTAAMDIEDYVCVPGLIAIIQNYMFAKSVTELFVDDVNVYRIPDNGNHPVLDNYGYSTNQSFTELIISYA